MFAETAAGKVMPIDFEPHPNGNILLSDLGRKVRAHVMPAGQTALEPAYIVRTLRAARNATEWRKDR